MKRMRDGKKGRRMSDLIKRETVLAFVRRCKDRLQGKGLTYDMLVDYIESIPSAERKGEWIEHRPPTNDYCGMVECPFCGEELVGEPTDFNYCPNCGARMKGEHNGQ